MQEVPTSFAAVIDAFGGAGPFSIAIGIPDSHARAMKTRDSIPATRWQATASAAQNNKISGITLELLARLGAERTHQRQAERVS